MNFETLSVSTDDGICTVMMNRPDKLNAMNVKMRRELGDCFNAIADDTAVRVVVLTGSGTAFSSGGDINDFKGTPEELHVLMGRLSHRWFRAMWNLPQPVLGAINGPAGGGGCNLALGCDMVYASERAYFVQTFLEIGLVPDLGGAFTLPRLIGPARAKEMALLGERIDAKTAASMGLINAVFPHDQLMGEVMRRARHIADRSTAAVSLTKRIINRACESSMESVLEDEHMAQSYLFGTEASKRGVEYFLGARSGKGGSGKSKGA